jgi:hypothetical protein
MPLIAETIGTPNHSGLPMQPANPSQLHLGRFPSAPLHSTTIPSASAYPHLASSARELPPTSLPAAQRPLTTQIHFPFPATPMLPIGP